MRWSALFALALSSILVAPRAVADEDDDPDEDAPSALRGLSDVGLEAAAPARMRPMSATVGGAQDARYFRDQASRGTIPRPDAFSVEGLLSEHDLPLADPPPCRRLICPAGVAMAADLVAQPEVGWVAQLGFTSRLDAETFERSPLNLVVVVDESGSMSGSPLQLVKESLSEIARYHLGPKDQVSIVTFADTARVELGPTPASDTGRIEAAIAALAVDGGTYLDAGLAVGIDVARTSRTRFDGQTRILLLTDERPNIGRTDAHSFKARLEAASRDGIGLTTIGVGVDFGAALAQEVAAVRGANLVYFADPMEMRAALARDFETLVTPLAYGMDLVVRPAPGLELAGIYGIPGDAVTRGEDGAMHLHVATLFASKGGGGIFLGFSGAPMAVRPGAPVATVELGYDPLDGPRSEGSVDLTLATDDAVGEGLVRGWRLVDEATALRAASLRYHNGDSAGALQVLDALARRWVEVTDRELEEEKRLVDDLRVALGSTAPPLSRDLVSGLPR